MTITPPTRPAPLSIYRINSPAEKRAWESAEADYWATVRRIAQAEQDVADIERAEANRVLGEQEYYIMACQRENENKAKVAATLAAEKEAAQAEADRLAATPAVAEIMHRSEWAFLQEVCHWSRRQYALSDLHSCMPGLYHATMNAPAAKAGK